VLAPMPRGILAVASAPLADEAITEDQAREAYAKAYDAEPFVQLLPAGVQPSTKSVVGSNLVQLQVAVDPDAGRLVVTAAVDNLTKGTAGGAFQSVNLALGLPETLGLPATGMHP
jgi:N-acetyl-gamma-glutamyl-phosphate reductase